jgi:hypothetical protein
MTDRDFRLLTVRISLTAPMVKKPTAATKPARPCVSVQRRLAGKTAR